MEWIFSVLLDSGEQMHRSAAAPVSASANASATPLASAQGWTRQLAAPHQTVSLVKKTQQCCHWNTTEPQRMLLINMTIIEKQYDVHKNNRIDVDSKCHNTITISIFQSFIYFFNLPSSACMENKQIQLCLFCTMTSWYKFECRFTCIKQVQW